MECETVLETWEGPQAARLYDFTARQIAGALTLVATGVSYRAAADWARRTAGRSGQRARGTRTVMDGPMTNGQLVGDWVEVFGPVIAAAYGPSQWPAGLAIDSSAFRYNQGGRNLAAFSVLGIAGYNAGSSKPRLLGLRAVSSASGAEWSAFLNVFPNAPSFAVSDGDSAIKRVLTNRWGNTNTVLYRCEWHLGLNFRNSFANSTRLSVEDREALDKAATTSSHRQPHGSIRRR